MNRLAFVNAKGGVGKTTSAVLVACALAEHGKTALIDSDPQRSATAWHAFATESGSPLPLALVDSLRTPLPEDLEWVVLDTPPGDEQLIRNALDWADLAVLPTRPGLLELLQLTPLLDLAASFGTSAAVLLTQTRAGVRETVEAYEGLSSRGVALFDTQVPLRAATSRLAGRAPTSAELQFTAYADVAQEIKEAF